MPDSNHLPACFVAAGTVASAIPLLPIDRAGLPALLAAQPARVRRWAQAQAFTAEPATALVVPDDDGAIAAVLVGIDDAADPFALAHLPYTLPEGDYRLDPAGTPIAAADALLGWGLGAYRFDRYRRAPRAPARLLLPEHNRPEHDKSAHAHPAHANQELAQALALLDASVLVRDLVNTPTEDMGPEQLEATVRGLADRYGAQLEVVVGDALLQHNFPAIHAVGRASHRAPRLIKLHWRGPGTAADAPHVAIVGKGVCFDTGGLNIKLADGMRRMKKDMGGAAHAIALAQLVMARALPLRITLLVPAVENAIGPNAFRPGEVVATRVGISVEIDNTDAEGRMVLCDALAYAAESKPALILDFATLTGAARVALGPELPALYANDDTLANDYLAAAARARDPIWRMPLWTPYLGYLKSDIADLANAGPSRMAGSISAALYLQRFVPTGQAWAHSDVYAWNDADRPGHPVGGEAQGLRAAFALLQARCARA